MKIRTIVALGIGVTLIGCGSPTTPTATTTFQGVIAGTNDQTGTLAVTIQTQVASAFLSPFRQMLVATLFAESVNATGTVHVAGSSNVSLNGTYDSTSKNVSLSGGGFNFAGAVSNGAITGTYQGPNGVTGNFGGRTTTGGTVTTYCGNVFGTDGPATGVFNLAVSGSTGAVSGAFRVSPYSGFITGQVTGTALSLTYTDPVAGQTGTATGTVQNGAVSGTSNSGNPFSGTTAKCQ